MITEALIIVFVFFLGYITATVLSAAKMASIAEEADKKSAEARESCKIAVSEFRRGLADHMNHNEELKWSDVEYVYSNIMERIK